jgi:DNA-directed RNA polymerase subunit RPC12/RpoP
MAILKLNCQGCHKRFEVDEDTIDWKVKDNWFSLIHYRVVYCPRCGWKNCIDWIEHFRREEE